LPLSSEILEKPCQLKNPVLPGTAVLISAMTSMGFFFLLSARLM
jgi:hypothetical protein